MNRFSLFMGACTLHFSFCLFAILPLPYPLEPAIEEEILSPIIRAARDPKSIEAYNDLYSGSQSREMELSSFENQNGAIGYIPKQTFTVAPELKSRVDFWKKIYSEYTSSQAVIHDSEYPELIYGVVYVGEYTKDDGTPYHKRMRLMNNFFQSEKEKITKQLIELHAHHESPEKMPVELFTLFKKFESIRERNKFLNATQRIRAQVGQREHIVKGFFSGGKYFPEMMKIFAKKKVPQELTRLPLVESAFNLNARSKVGASGVWQFMRTTGKMYLNINRAVDERNDPISATWAAADLLRQNYEALGSWPLAITAYNHGRAGVARAVRTTGTTNLATIIKQYKSNSFGFASSNFYAEFLAILEVERDYRKHFGKLMVDSPLEYEEITVIEDSHLEDLAEGCKMKTRELAFYNPALTDWVVSGRGQIPQGFRLKVPENRKEKCRSSRKTLSQNSRVAKKSKLSFNSKSGKRTARNP